MKFLIFLTVAVVATFASGTVLSSQWNSFKSIHKKQYNNPLEEVYRMSVYKEKLAEIQEHNAKYANGEVTYFKKINQFSDWTKEEFMAYVNKGKLSRPKINPRLHFPYVPNVEPRAASVDWRGKAVSEVKDQAQCGSCWSFSATGALEGQSALKGKGLVSLSEQNLIDCSSSYGNSGCDGGWMDTAFEYIHDQGIMSEAAYPYEAIDGKCRFNPSQSITKISGYNDLPQRNEEALADACAKNGPIAVAVDATPELQSYGGGIILDKSCSNSDVNHGVLVVGYGSENGQDYWIVKNSWGDRWGEGGYYRSARNANNNCAIATYGSFPIL